MVNITKSQQISTLQRPTWLDAAGLSKGINHDRQHLGIILEAGQVIKVRQTNAAFNDKLTLYLLNDDQKTQAWVYVGSDWAELSVKAASVPFINTPFTTTPHSTIMPVVEFEYPDTSKKLPVYRKGEKESEFFALWDSQNAEFALIEAQYVMILVPSVDKGNLKAMGKIDNIGGAMGKIDIDGLIDHYQDIFTFYNELAGISFEPQRPTDLNIGNRYFLKADKQSSGANYAGGGWAMAYSVSGYWIPPGEGDEWSALHEIGHGYEGNFASIYFDRAEVWNNIYAACYQRVMLGDRKYKEGWLYDYGHPEVIEKDVTDLIHTGKAVNEWDLWHKLYFLMMMVEKASMNAFTYFNQQYRLNCNSSDFVKEEHDVLDMLSASFAIAGNQVDVTPFVKLVGGHITPSQREHNVLRQAKAVYPLKQLVADSMLATLQQQLKLESPLSLVDVQQLRSSGLKGDVKLRLNIDDFSQIREENLILLDGGRYVRALPIGSQELELKNLPIGVYTMRLPTGKNKKYKIQDSYLVVKQGDNQQQVDFMQKIGSPLVTQEIQLSGLTYLLIATVLVDQAKGKVTMDVTSKNPNVEFLGPNYAQVVVRNKDNVELFSKTIPGANATLSHDEVPFSFGDKIEIYNADLSAGMHLKPPLAGVIDLNVKTNILQITAFGLKNEALGNDPEAALLPRLEKAATALRRDGAVLHASFAGAKDDLYLAINTVANPQQRADLLAKYADCLPSNNAAPSDKPTLKSGRKLDLVQLKQEQELSEPQQDIAAIDMPDISQGIVIGSTIDLAGNNINESL